MFRIIGVAATVWAAYIVLKNKDFNAGITDLKNRVIGDMPLKPTMVTPSVPVTTVVNTNTSVPSESAAVKAVTDKLDWGIQTSQDVFTPQGRAANADWTGNIINAGWEQHVITS